MVAKTKVLKLISRAGLAILLVSIAIAMGLMFTVLENIEKIALSNIESSLKNHTLNS